MIYGDDNDMLVEGPLLPEGEPRRCPYCGESYQFRAHPGCLKKALAERDAARTVARLAVVAWRARQDSLSLPGCGHDEPEIQALYEEHSWLKESDDPRRV